MNAGVREATGELLLFLNNDLRLQGDFIRTLAAPLIEDPTLFAADGLQWDWEGRVRVHGRTRAMVRPFWSGYLDLQQDYPDRCSLAFMASAANALVRRWMFEELGGWDEAYLIGWEDVDRFWRAWHRGWRTVFVPDAVCWHKVGASAGTELGAAIRLHGSLEGRLYFSTKCLPSPGALVVWAKTWAGLLRDIGTGRWRQAWRKGSALRRAVHLVGSALRARRRLYSDGPRPLEYLRALGHLVD